MSLPEALEDQYDAEWQDLEREQTMAKTGPPVILRAEARGEARGERMATRNKILRLIEKRFGLTPDTLRTRIERVVDIAELDRLFDEAVLANSLEEVHLPDEERP